MVIHCAILTITSNCCETQINLIKYRDHGTYTCFCDKYSPLQIKKTQSIEQRGVLFRELQPISPLTESSRQLYSSEPFSSAIIFLRKHSLLFSLLSIAFKHCSPIEMVIEAYPFDTQLVWTLQYIRNKDLQIIIHANKLNHCIYINYVKFM